MATFNFTLKQSMELALQEIIHILSVFDNDDFMNVINPEQIVCQHIQEYLNANNTHCITLTQLHNRMKNMPIKINHRKSKRKKGKPNCLREVVQNLYGIDGMDIRFPWKIRCNKFISFVQSIPGLIAQFNDNISDYQISIDQRMNILPFFAIFSKNVQIFRKVPIF